MATVKGLITYEGYSMVVFWTVFLANILLYVLLTMVVGALLHIGWALV